MTDETMTCERFEELLADYLEGDVDGVSRTALDAHAGSCAHCAALVADLKRIAADAATLPSITPPRSVWAGIESRIATEVVTLAPRHRRTIPLVRGLAAAAAMIAITASVTWVVTRQQMQRGREQQVARDVAAANGTPVQLPTDPAPAMAAGNIGADSTFARGTVRSASNAGRHGDRSLNASEVYGQEITRLRSVLRQRRRELDPRTVASIERSLAVIDTAIAQARAALAADPASRFLNGELSDVLDKKVQLLRTAAMLPAST